MVYNAVTLNVGRFNSLFLAAFSLVLPVRTSQILLTVEPAKRAWRCPFAGLVISNNCYIYELDLQQRSSRVAALVQFIP